MVRAAPAALAALLAFMPVAAAAQGVCAGQPIRRIDVRTAPVITATGRPFSSLIQHIANGLSWRTRPTVVRRELRFAEGEPCDPRRFRETARVLRNQPYVLDAVVTASDAGDSVDVLVRTRDEFALGGSIRLDAGGTRQLKGFRITENNFFGQGMLTELRYDYLGRHAGIVLDVLDRQLLGGRSSAEVTGGRSSVGPVWEASWRRTFDSEYDRAGWQTGARYREEPFNFSSTLFGSVVQPLVSEGFELAAVRRIGRQGRQLLAGLALSSERLFITDQVLASLPADDSAAGVALAGRFTERRRVAGSVVLGVRDVRFASRPGVDAVNAPQDVRKGIEVSAILGHTLGAGRGLQEDRFAIGSFYAGAELGARTLAFLRGRVEGRSLSIGGDWDGVIAAGDAYLYQNVGRRTNLFVAARAAGGWHTSTPFQLVVSAPSAMRGFGLNALPVGRRVVVQAEHRYFLGTLFGAVDLGTSVFADAGRGWAGDAPFGEDTGTLVALGGGLRFAFPSGSRPTSRLDVAFPVRGGRGVEVRVTVGLQLGISSPEPADVVRSRLPISTIDLFNFQRY